MSFYALKEMFLTLQGEGVQAGRRALFIRFAGCNLWSGRERHRAGAVCGFCDTDFVGTDGPGGGRLAAQGMVARAAALWGDAPGRFAVLTGGEPLLQVDPPLIAALAGSGFEIAVETNGTVKAPAGIDWLTVSPKAGSETLQRSGDELKLVWPQEGLDPELMLEWEFDHFLIQPMDCAEGQAARAEAVAYVMDHPRWRLSLQDHKILGLR